MIVTRSCNHCQHCSMLKDSNALANSVCTLSRSPNDTVAIKDVKTVVDLKEHLFEAWRKDNLNDKQWRKSRAQQASIAWDAAFNAAGLFQNRSHSVPVGKVPMWNNSSRS